MHSNWQVAYGFIGMLAGFVLIGLIILFSLRLKDVRRRRADERSLAKHGEWLATVLAHLDGEEPLNPSPEPVQSDERRLVLERLISWIEQFRGEPRAKLILLCERMGFAEQELKRLDSPFQWVKLDAAHRLGCLRVHAAVPGMLKLLGSMRSGPLVFIVARAVAKCARDPEELRDMAHLLLAHKKEAEPLIADVLLESPLDYTAMLQTFLRSDDPERIRLALAAMRKVGLAGSADRLFELTRSAHAGIRQQAAKLLLRESASLADAQLRKLLGHADRDIRAEAALAVGGLRRRKYAGLLRASMNDADWQVRMNSAFALAKLGEDGLAVLREAADTGAEPQAEAARAALRESRRRREAGAPRRSADWVPVRSV